jgi:uncharacterized membrane protein
MNDKLTLLLLYLVAGSLLAALSLPLLRGKIGRNWFYGFRLPKTFKSNAIWYAANKYAAKRLLWAAIAFVLGAIGLYLVPGLSVDGYALGCLAAFAIVFLIGFVQSILYLRSL